MSGHVLHNMPEKMYPFDRLRLRRPSWALGVGAGTTWGSDLGLGGGNLGGLNPKTPHSPGRARGSATGDHLRGRHRMRKPSPPPDPAVDDLVFVLTADDLESALWRAAGGERVADVFDELCAQREAKTQ